MKLLLDTHALLWWLAGEEALPPAARRAIGEVENEVFVSAASAWEIATKVRLGKLPGAAGLEVSHALRDQGFSPLAVTVEHAERAGALPGPHRDPFDRMLIVQALLEDCRLVTNERLFDRYGVRRLW